MDYAQILLDNLSGWPEHFQLVGALHRVEPQKAYEEVKQLAISIEQSKIMLEVNKYKPLAWKNRYAQYQGKKERTQIWQKPIARPFNHQEIEMQIQHNAKTVHSGEARKASIGDRSSATQEPKYGEAIQGRKCYHCSKYGHIARECPSRMGNVNHRDRKKFPSKNEETKLSSIIERNRSMGMKARRKRSDDSDLIGKRIMVPVRLLGDRCTALVDTGSMISIIPLKVLAKAQDRGWDVDSLKVVPKSRLKPVFDASNKRMDFVGAVHIEVEMDSGNTEMIAFHISRGQDESWRIKR
ncbi:zinc knuckle [Cooperia oncophora]